MIKLDQDYIDIATVAMCEAAQVPSLDIQQGTPLYNDMRDQVVAFVLALNKNYEREKTYQGLWKLDSLAEIAHNAVHKGKRLTVHGVDSIEAADNATDDAIDLINYGAFAARIVHYAARDAGLTGPDGR